MIERRGGNNQRLAQILGILTKDKNHPVNTRAKDFDRSMYSCEKYQFFLYAPFEISNKCCGIMKKNPSHNYYKQTGRVPITAQMAEESRLRTMQWLKNSCNGFNLKIPTSNPMSFWTEQDVLQYIKQNDLPICSVYGDVVTDAEEMGQIELADYEGFEQFRREGDTLHCTGCKRTGCVCCGFGAHINGDERFTRLKETHPQMYKLLDIAQNSGYTMRQAIDWINENSDVNIKY